ncbi:MAG: Gfo/Idh/MocA family oxidoreductase [Thermoguttaceae bacterium]|jgi:predicted dehydrogenase
MRNPPEVSRREFLRRGVLAGAASFALPGLIPRSVLAAPGRPGANDRIGIAGIGIGRQGTDVLTRAVKSPDGRFIGIADVNLPRAQEKCRRLHGGLAVQDYRRILDRKDVDAIVTATPEHWRAIICIAACQAGKDIYAEKPVSLTIREGRLMVAAARKYQRVFQVGSQQRSMAVCRAGCELVRSGGLGNISKIIAMRYPSPFNCGLPGQSVPAGLDWDMWCGPTEPAPYHAELYIPRGRPGWLSFRPYSGGEMTGWGAHGLDMIQWALGMDASGPSEIWTEGQQFDPPTITAPETAVRANVRCSHPAVFWRYANGVTLVMDEVFGSQPGKPAPRAPSFGAIVHGEKGTAVIDRGKFTSDPPELAEQALEGVKNTETHVENWMASIKSRKLPNADIEIGHRSATVCHLGNIARWTGRKLRWDPAQESFLGDAEANSYLDRPRRKPYVLPERV